MKVDNSLRICLVASSGGHLTELLTLSDSWDGCETFCVTTVPIVHDKLKKLGDVYVVGECNRQHPVLVLRVLLRCIKVVFRERPNVIISTGAAVGCIMCFLGKLLRAKIIWLDSITNVNKMSLSGKMVRCIADLQLVQWPELSEQYKDVEYVGTVI